MPMVYGVRSFVGVEGIDELVVTRMSPNRT